MLSGPPRRHFHEVVAVTDCNNLMKTGGAGRGGEGRREAKGAGGAGVRVTGRQLSRALVMSPGSRVPMPWYKLSLFRVSVMSRLRIVS